MSYYVKFKISHCKHRAIKISPMELKSIYEEDEHEDWTNSIFQDENQFLPPKTHPRYEADLIARALFNEFDKHGRKTVKHFRNYDGLNVLKRFVKTNPDAEMISAEDLAWVNSCIVAGQDLPLENWVLLKEALLDSITNFSASYDVNNEAGMNEDGEENVERMEIDKEPEIANAECGDVCDDMRLWELEITVCTENEFESEDSLFKLWDLLEEENDHEHNIELKWLDDNGDGN